MFMSDQYDAINQECDASGVQLVSVSKTFSPEIIQAAYDHGCRHFGENKALELRDKHEALPKDISWHFIGHLQTNKVKYIAPFVHLIHSVDSLKLLREINKQGRKIERRIDCLLQFHIAEESTKYGLDLNEAKELLGSEHFASMQHIRICGVMGMATFTDNMDQVEREFAQLKELFDTLKQSFFTEDDAFREISMGMSADWRQAIQHGSTMVRIGSLIFGKRKR